MVIFPKVGTGISKKKNKKSDSAVIGGK